MRSISVDHISNGTSTFEIFYPRSIATETLKNDERNISCGLSLEFGEMTYEVPQSGKSCSHNTKIN
jgi:hypothetical protein